MTDLEIQAVKNAYANVEEMFTNSKLYNKGKFEIYKVSLINVIKTFKKNESDIEFYQAVVEAFKEIGNEIAPKDIGNEIAPKDIGK